MPNTLCRFQTWNMISPACVYITTEVYPNAVRLFQILAYVHYMLENSKRRWRPVEQNALLASHQSYCQRWLSLGAISTCLLSREPYLPLPVPQW